MMCIESYNFRLVFVSFHFICTMNTKENLSLPHHKLSRINSKVPYNCSGHLIVHPKGTISNCPTCDDELALIVSSCYDINYTPELFDLNKNAEWLTNFFAGYK